MKIYYFGKFGKHHTERYIADALKAQGHSVYRSKIDLYRPLQNILNDINELKPDIFLMAKCYPHIYPLENLLKKIDMPKVTWLFDLFIDAPKNMNRTLNEPFFTLADKVFTTDGGHDKEWAEAGINHTTLRQGIHKPEHILYEAEQDIDISFIGSHSYDYRAILHRHLGKTYGNNYHRFGLNQEIRGLELNQLLARTKIVVGDSVPSPRYWSNRLYEICGRGGFMIFPYVEGIKEEIPSLVTYEWGNLEDLDKKIRYYLENEDEREQIRRKCFEECGKHTYDERVKQLIWNISK